VAFLGYTDINSYYKIATDKFSSGNYPGHHLERWFFHVLAGILSDLLHVDVWKIYQVMVLLCILSVTWIIFHIKCMFENKVAILVFILFSTYTFRIYWAFPGMISDAIFYTATVGVVVGLMNGNNKLLISSIVFAVLTKQTVVFFIPAFIVMSILNVISHKKAVGYSILVAVFYLLIHLSTKFLFNVESNNHNMLNAVFGIFFWFGNPFSWNEAVDFFGRYLLFILCLLPVILFLTGNNTDYKKLAPYFFAFLIVQMQPILAGPVVTGGNIQRLASFAIPFLIPLMMQPIKREKLFLFIILVSIISMHHHFSILSNFDSARNVFLFLIMMASITVLFVKLKKQV